MAVTYWHKQAADAPLFGELLWSQPENKNQAGKLLIIGGNVHGFRAPAETYNESVKAGIGAVRVMLPVSLQKTVSKLFVEADFAPSTPSGSFSQLALAEALAAAEWSDGGLLAGDTGHNSETAIMLEAFVKRYRGPLVITGDCLDNLKQSMAFLLTRPGTIICPNFAQLQQIMLAANQTKPIVSSMDLIRFVDSLHELTSTTTIGVIINYLETICVAADGQVSTTKITSASPTQTQLTAHAGVWLVQNPDKQFEALSTAAYRSVASQSKNIS